jgi:tRNA dimethylallyltransferase
MNHMIAVVGPTAAGKSALALQLAQDFNGEIINADSRQVYRYMDIGTAKPGKTERELVPHHLIDVLNPDESFSLALYQSSTYSICRDIKKRNKIPFLTGGTGQYVWSAIEGWKIPDVPPDEKLRKKLERVAAEYGGAMLYEELKKVNPSAAGKIDQNNVRRIIRAIEISQAKADPAQVLWKKEPPDCSILIIGLNMKRTLLYKRIDDRVDDMIKRGLVDEVRGLLDMGYSLDLPSLSGIGYRQIGKMLQGEWTLDFAIERIKYETHRFARKQYNWFRTNDARIHWFDVCDNIRDSVNGLVRYFLRENNQQG